MIASQFYGTFTDHLTSVLPLLALACVLFACSKTGQSSSRNNQRARDASLANRGELRRVVGQRRTARRCLPGDPKHEGTTSR